MLFKENVGGPLCVLQHHLAGIKKHKYFMINKGRYQDDFNLRTSLYRHSGK